MILAGLEWWLEGGSAEERLKGDGQIWGHRVWVAWCGGLGLRKYLCHHGNEDLELVETGRRQLLRLLDPREDSERCH